MNPRPTDGDQLTVKVDHKFSSADTITGRFYRNKATGIVGGGNINDLASPRGNLVQGVTFSNTHLFASNLVSEARVSLTKLETAGPVAAVNQTPQQLGAVYAQDGSIALAPTTNVSGAFNLQPNQPWLERSQLVDFDVKMSWITGRQSFRFGFMGLHQSQRLQTAFQSSGVFTFDGTITGNPTADYMLGRPRSFVQQSVLDNLERSQTYSAFFQDDIKVGRRLTLNAGLRYDLFLPWDEEGGRSATLRPGQQSTRYSNAPPGLVYPGDAGVPNGLVPTDKNNWAPRVGLAWDVKGDGRTSIRGAYGLFYTPQGSITVANQNEAPPFVQVVSLASPGSLRDPYAGNISPFPYTESASGDALFFYPTQVFSVDPAFRTGYVHQYNANVQQQFGSQFIVQAGYFGARGRQLASSREINAPVYGPGATAGNAQQRRPYLPQNFAGISQAFSDSSSDYDALQVSATQKYARGVTVQLAYTLSRSMDNRSTGSTDAASVQNPNDPFDGGVGAFGFRSATHPADQRVVGPPSSRESRRVETCPGRVAAGGYRRQDDGSALHRRVRPRRRPGRTQSRSGGTAAGPHRQPGTRFGSKPRRADCAVVQHRRLRVSGRWSIWQWRPQSVASSRVFLYRRVDQQEIRTLVHGVRAQHRAADRSVQPVQHGQSADAGEQPQFRDIRPDRERRGRPRVSTGVEIQLLNVLTAFVVL